VRRAEAAGREKRRSKWPLALRRRMEMPQGAEQNAKRKGRMGEGKTAERRSATEMRDMFPVFI